MTSELFKKAERINQEIESCRHMVRHIDDISTFKRVKKNDDPNYRGIDFELKPEYKQARLWFLDRIEQLNEEFKAL